MSERNHMTDILRQPITKVVLGAGGAVLALTLAGCGGASEAQPAPTSPDVTLAQPTPQSTPSKQGFDEALLGYDVSHPQCGTVLPTPGAFAIIGVNGERADKYNPCYQEQVAWAKQSSGVTAMPRFSAYVQGASPGNTSPRWPTEGTSEKYGECDGSDSEACAYLYGKFNITEDLKHMKGKVPPIVFVVGELEFSWDISQALNSASLDGMGDAIREAGAEPGVYSSADRWQTITGGLDANHSLAIAPVWLMGAREPEQALEMCQTPSFTGGSIVAVQMAGEINGVGIDTNVSC